MRASWCGFHDRIDDTECDVVAVFTVRRLVGGPLELRACEMHLMDVLMTTDGLEPPWVVWPVAEEVTAAFFEEDEPVAKALAAFEAGEKGVTGWPEGVPERVQAEAVALGIREFYEGGVAPLPDGVAPERVEVTATYGVCPGCGRPWPCAEVQRLSKEWEEGA